LISRSALQLLAFALITPFALLVSAQSTSSHAAKIQVDASQPSGTISPLLFGQNIEYEHGTFSGGEQNADHAHGLHTGGRFAGVPAATIAQCDLYDL
jgi:hypothetical protein